MVKHGLVIVACVLAIGAVASAEVRYQVIDIGTMPGTTTSQAVAINNHNQITGFCGAWERAFIWENGVFTDIGGFGGNHNRPKSINDNGQITGVSSYSSGMGKAFLWQNGSGILDVGSLHNYGSYGYDINNNGQIVGNCGRPGPGQDAFLWQNNLMTNLGLENALAINNAGLIAGKSQDGHSAIWNNGSIIDLGLFGGSSPEPHDINDMGQVVVFSHNYSDGISVYNAAFLWDNGIETNLGVLPGFRDAQPYSINNTCQIVGESLSSIVQHGPKAAAFLWENGTMFDLNNLIPENSGWFLEAANGINDNGYIVGYGYNRQGDLHGFLLEPIPEPAMLVLLALGGVLMAKRRK